MTLFGLRVYDKIFSHRNSVTDSRRIINIYMLVGHEKRCTFSTCTIKSSKVKVMS